MTDVLLQGGGFQLDGPGIVENVCKNMRDQSMTPTSYHEYWLRSAEIPKGDRSTCEHECLSRILESLVMVDQLNVGALQGAEVVCRRIQVISNPDYSAAEFCMGWRYRKGAYRVEPAG